MTYFFAKMEGEKRKKEQLKRGCLVILFILVNVVTHACYALQQTVDKHACSVCMGEKEKFIGFSDSFGMHCYD